MREVEPTVRDEESSAGRSRPTGGTSVAPLGRYTASRDGDTGEPEGLPSTCDCSEELEQLGSDLRKRDLQRRVFNFTDEDLLELAKTCSVRADSPGRITESTREDVGMTDEEHAAYEALRVDFTRRHGSELSKLAEEAGLKVHPNGMVLSAADPSLLQVLAEERAGLREPTSPDDRSARERYLRTELSVGDRFEEELAAEIGTRRARELRVALDGWGGRILREGCPSE